jgi:hypothetical protein
MSAMVKHQDALVDMSMLTTDEKNMKSLIKNGRSKRPPPMAPDAFKEMLQTGRFRDMMQRTPRVESLC